MFSPSFWITPNLIDLLMMAQGVERSPITSLDAETDLKPIIIILFYFYGKEQERDLELLLERAHLSLEV